MLKVSEQSKKSGGWIQSCVLSGLLLGLSVPSFPFLPLGFLAWAWLVPLLFELKKTERFGAFLVRTAIAVGIGFTMITIWVVNASVLGLLASMLMGTVVWTIPLVWFCFVRRFWNWNAALLSLPFAWTAWEWLYHQTEFSFGAVRQGYLQADLLWLIQYADVTGVEGVTFWLVSLNVALFVFIEKHFGNVNLKFSRKTFLNREAIAPLLLLVLPLVYAAFVFLKTVSAEKEITILAVQPNVSPLADYSAKNLPDIFGKQLALTDKALKTGDAPDLIVWHEVAVPYVLSEDVAANDYLAKQIKKWNAPILTGLIEVKNYPEKEPRPLLLVAQNRFQEFFNAAAVFQPEEIENGELPIDLQKLYLKRRLMPFLEHVPFSDSIPALADLVIPIGTRPRLSYGESEKIFAFTAKDGSTVRVGTMICYENLYPEMSADAVRAGAQFLTAITNEGFFAGSQGQYQLAAFSRFRSIETRRALVRAAATGKTWTTDEFGRVTADAPMWSEQTLRARVRLSDEQTIYVRWGNFFPKFCALVALLLAVATVSRIFQSRVRAWRRI